MCEWGILSPEAALHSSWGNHQSQIPEWGLCGCSWGRRSSWLRGCCSRNSVPRERADFVTLTGPPPHLWQKPTPVSLMGAEGTLSVSFWRCRVALQRPFHPYSHPSWKLPAFWDLIALSAHPCQVLQPSFMACFIFYHSRVFLNFQVRKGGLASWGEWQTARVVCLKVLKV